MAFVLDASIAVRWFLIAQQTPYSLFVMSLLTSEAMHVPPIWPVEMASALVREENKGTISSTDVALFFILLDKGSIRIAGNQADAQTLVGDARHFGLAPADASYVRLALDLGLPLASADDRMCEAARRVGVPLLRPPTH